MSSHPETETRFTPEPLPVALARQARNRVSDAIHAIDSAMGLLDGTDMAAEYDALAKLHETLWEVRRKLLPKI